MRKLVVFILNSLLFYGTEISANASSYGENYSSSNDFSYSIYNDSYSFNSPLDTETTLHMSSQQPGKKTSSDTALVAFCGTDRNCSIYRDCCEDNDARFLKMSPPAPAYRYLQCRTLPGHTVGPYPNRNYDNSCGKAHDETFWMVSSCPKRSPHQQDCEKEPHQNSMVQVKFIRPVFDAAGYVYKNEFCARCHKISMERTTPWPLFQVCSLCADYFALSQDQYVNLSDTNCLLYWQEYGGFGNYSKLRHCNDSIIRSCPAKSDYSFNCSGPHSALSPIEIQGTFFKNSFCARCHGMNNISLWKQTIKRDCSKTSTLSLSNAIMFREPLCSVTGCFRPSYPCDSYAQYLTLVLREDIQCPYLRERAWRCFTKSSQNVTQMMKHGIFSREMDVSHSVIFTANGRHDMTRVIVAGVIDRTPNMATLQERLRQEIELLSVSNNMYNNCYLKQFELIDVCSSQTWETLGQCNGEVVETEGDEILYHVGTSGIENSNHPLWFTVHTTFPIGYDQAKINRTLLCLLEEDNNDNIFRVFSFLCLAVSVVSNALTFVVYVILKPLRNTFGYALMCFVLSNASAQLMLEFVAHYAIGVDIVCEVVACLSHFFWLSSFSWITTIAWDLFVTLSPKRLQVRKMFSVSRKRFSSYVAFGFGVPFSIVCCCLLLWLFPSVGVSYGSMTGDVVCWLGGEWAVLLAVGVPLVSCLLTNSVLFTLTVSSLHKHGETLRVLQATSQARLCHQSRKVDVMVYFKISLLMGIAWIFGFLADFLQFSMMWWLYYLSFAIQGILIFCFYGLSRRARRLLAAKVKARSFLSPSSLRTSRV